MSSAPKHNLVALSSAAIIAVYAAGYVRTNDAAAKIAERGERRPPVRAAARRESASRPGADTQPPSAAAHTAAQRPPRLRAKRKATENKAADTDVVGSAPAPSTATPTDTNPHVDTRPHADTSSHADTSKVVWKDGYYFGWGTSRHGDIQAGLEIKDGRIVSALITQCLTQYSCSWIDALQGQVVARQSPDVDFVSGATQSTNAFYYAVVEALRKAR